MKKILILLFSCMAVWAFGDGLHELQEPLLLLNPSRETFLNFPSAVLPQKTVTVFLPEPAVPLTRAYPVIYVLGAIPKEAPFAQDLLERTQQKAILVGLNTTEEDLADPAKITTFFTRELIPYIDTNYLTVSLPQRRALVVQGAAGLRVAAALLAKKEVFGAAAFWQPGQHTVSWDGIEKTCRIWIGGQRPEIVALQQLLEEKKFVYGPDFVTYLQSDSAQTWWEAVNVDYLFAPTEKLQIKKIKGFFTPSAVLHIDKQEAVNLTWKVLLTNGMMFDYIASSLSITPPYLIWDSATGMLTLRAGALPEKVKISTFVDKTPWKGKMKLKK